MRAAKVIVTPPDRTARPLPPGCGAPLRYACFTSADGRDWGAAKLAGEFANIEHNPILQNLVFGAPAEARFLRLDLTGASAGMARIALAEVGVLPRT